MIVKLLTDHHLQCLSSEWGCRGLSASTHIKMPHCWKSRALAQISLCVLKGACMNLYIFLSCSAGRVMLDSRSISWSY